MKLSAMQRLSLAVVAIAVISVLPAHADEWSKTYQLTGKPELRIETRRLIIAQGMAGGEPAPELNAQPVEE